MCYWSVMSARRCRRRPPEDRGTLRQLLELPDPVLADHLFGHTPVSDPPPGPSDSRDPWPSSGRILMLPMNFHGRAGSIKVAARRPFTLRE